MGTELNEFYKRVPKLLLLNIFKDNILYINRIAMADTQQTENTKITKSTPKTKKAVKKETVETQQVSEVTTEVSVAPPTPTPTPEVKQKNESIEIVMTTNDKFQHILQTLTELKKTIVTVIDDVKKLQKEKKKTKNTNLKSGFVKQVPVTPVLAEFVGIKLNDIISRVDVTKFITEYIKTNDLQVKENKQHFTLDKKLANLFSMDENSQIHYFKLQAHLKDHYPKQTPQVAVN
jgi:chromatin remodeling complex protein RSC6